MKMKTMISTLAIIATITTGTVATTTLAHADSTNVSVKKQSTPSIKEVYLTGSNVLRFELAEPFKTTDKEFLFLLKGENEMIANAVETNGKIVAFDINLNDFAERYPTKKDREAVVNTLHLYYYNLESVESPIKRIDIKNDFATEKLMNAVNQNLPSVEKAYLEHYNVLRLELAKPYEKNNSDIALVHGDNMSLGKKVEENGKIIAFDINLDDFAKNYPNEKDRENILNSLHLYQIRFSGPFRTDKIKVEDEFITSTLMSAVNQGQLLPNGYVSNVTNVTKLEGYQKFVTKDLYADHTLNKQLTTETRGVALKYNKKYKEQYTFSLTNKDGEEAGFVRPVADSDDMAVQANTDKLLYQEYTISATSVATGETIKIAKFTPFRLF